MKISLALSLFVSLVPFWLIVLTCPVCSDGWNSNLRATSVALSALEWSTANSAGFDMTNICTTRHPITSKVFLLLFEDRKRMESG
jgi:hypothetical protein